MKRDHQLQTEGGEQAAEITTDDASLHEHAEMGFTSGGQVPPVESTTPLPPQPSASDRAFGQPQPALPHPADGGVLRTQMQRVVHGITIVAPPGTHVRAVTECVEIVEKMLGYNEVAQDKLAAERTTIVIVPARTKMTDLPQFASLQGKSTFDGRDWANVRGSGGLRAPDGSFAVGVAEENLFIMRSARSSYSPGYSIAMHELAHTLESQGMTDEQHKRLEALYQQQKKHDSKDFTDSYAATNVHEYFAQATNAFFGTNVSKDKNGKANQNGRPFLRSHDPDMFAFLVEMYETKHPREQSAN